MSLKGFVNNKPEWDAFLEELDECISQQHKSSETLSDPIEVYRAQGKISAYRNLKYLRDKVNG
jgi:hypothetical protein|tara:strand:- start:1294 stop:1482 length:189 start_codon:yes stop_codon:yes gene_type:complete